MTTSYGCGSSCLTDVYDEISPRRLLEVLEHTRRLEIIATRRRIAFRLTAYWLRQLCR